MKESSILADNVGNNILRKEILEDTIGLYMKMSIDITNKGRFQKYTKMKFSIELAGWVLNDPVFH